MDSSTVINYLEFFSHRTASPCTDLKILERNQSHVRSVLVAHAHTPLQGALSTYRQVKSSQALPESLFARTVRDNVEIMEPTQALVQNYESAYSNVVPKRASQNKRSPSSVCSYRQSNFLDVKNFC